MTVTEYRGYSIAAVRVTRGSTVYRIVGHPSPWNPLFYSLAAAQREVDALIA